MKNFIKDAFIVYGYIFIILILASFFYPVFTMVVEQRFYLLILFVALILGKYLLSNKITKGLWQLDKSRTQSFPLLANLQIVWWKTHLMRYILYHTKQRLATCNMELLISHSTLCTYGMLAPKYRRKELAIRKWSIIKRIMFVKRYKYNLSWSLSRRCAYVGRNTTQKIVSGFVGFLKRKKQYL